MMISKEPYWTFSLNEKSSTASANPSNESLQINSVAIDTDGKYSVFGSSSEFGKGKFALYFYNSEDGKCSSVPVSDQATYQGVFWVGISGNGQYAAAGGEHSKRNNGFLKAYAVSDHTPLLDVTLPARVNQVSLSHDGQLLLAVFDGTVQLYKLQQKSKQYQLSSHIDLKKSEGRDISCNSCVLANNGQRAVVSIIQYNNDKTTTGQVLSCDIVDGKASKIVYADLHVGSMRVAITDDGSYWGASLHDGSCVAFSDVNPAAPLWQCKPDNIKGLSLAYGFDITKTSAGSVMLAVGANTSGNDQGGGYVYLVESKDGKGTLLWGKHIEYAANPGISLDREARYVTATDGKPTDEKSKHIKESAGNFYLFNGEKGSLEWGYPTNLMNWPMMINRKGDKIIGASDNGTAYFWQK